MIIFLYLLACVNMIYLVHLGLFTIGANGYDILRFKKERDERRQQSTAIKKTVSKLKLVSVVIPAHNEGSAIKRTLDSVLANSYSNLEIIVVDDGSVDNTAKIVNDYFKKVSETKKLSVRTYFDKQGFFGSTKHRYLKVQRQQTKLKLITQTNQGKASAMNHAIKDYVSGEYVMCLDADSILHPKAIERAVNYLKNKQIIGVAANVRIIGGKSLLGKLQRFEHMVGYRSKKFYSLANCEFIIGGVGSTYRRSILRKVKFYDNDTMTEDIGLSLKIVATSGNKTQRVYYAADVVAFTEGVQNFKDLLRQRYRWKMGSLQNLFKYRSLIGEYQPTFYSRALTLYRLPMAILSEVLLMLEPLILGYIIYLSIAFHTLGIIFGAYLTITLYIMMVLWSDEHLPTKDKLKMSVSALWIYALFYIMDVVQTAAMIKSLRLYKKIIHRGSDLSTWVSPKRAKQIQAI